MYLSNVSLIEMEGSVNYRSLLLAATLFGNGCGKHSDNSDDGGSRSDAFALLVDSSKDRPACDAGAEGKLIYIKDDKQFQYCDGSKWVDIDLKGADGKNGENGTSGISLSSTLSCTKIVSSRSFAYKSATFSTGDVWATCSISDSLSEYSASVLYKASQNGAEDGSCLLTYDLDTGTSGFWEFTSSPSKQAVYSDSGSANDGTTVSFSAGDCTAG